MLQLLRYFFVTLGVIFFILLLGISFIWFTDTWGVRTVIEYTLAPKSITINSASTGSVEQAQALEEAGLDVSLFTDLSTVQEVCFIARLGEVRVAEIVAGAMPSAAEILQGAPCLQE